MTKEAIIEVFRAWDRCIVTPMVYDEEDVKLATLMSELFVANPDVSAEGIHDMLGDLLEQEHGVRCPPFDKMDDEYKDALSQSCATMHCVHQICLKDTLTDDDIARVMIYKWMAANGFPIDNITDAAFEVGKCFVELYRAKPDASAADFFAAAPDSKLYFPPFEKMDDKCRQIFSVINTFSELPSARADGFGGGSRGCFNQANS